MRPSTIATACTLFLSLPLCAQGDGQRDRGLKMIPVRHLLFRAGPADAPRLNTLLQAEDEPRRLLPEREFQVLQPDQLVELVRTATGRALDEDEASLQIIAGTLMVTGPKKTITAVEKAVHGIAAVMGRRLHLEARLYEARGNHTYPAVIKAGDLAETTQNLPMLWKVQAVSYSGQQIAMAQERFTSYVRDADVEVASKAKIGDPEVETVFEGVRLLVESHALVGGKEAVVLCQFAIGDLREPIAQRATGVAELSALGRPKLDSNFGSFGGRLHKGDALAVQVQSSAGSGSNLLLVLKVGDGRTRAGVIGATGAVGGPDTMAILPISALTSPSCMTLSEEIDEEENDVSDGHLPRWSEAHGEENEGDDCLDADQIVELLSSSLNLEQMDDVSVDHAAGYVLLKAGQGARAQAVRLLRSLQDQWLRTVEVRSTTTLTRVETSSGTLARPAAKEESRRYQSVTFPALLGRSHLLVKGVETCTTRDFDAEIAEESAILDPMVVNVFSGMAVNVTPVVAGQDIDVRLKLQLNHVTTAARRPTEQKEGGDLFLPTANHTCFVRNGAFEQGVDVSLGWGPVIVIEKQHYRMHQSIRLRKP
ncbi:MAG: hypothetical protein ACYTKC_20660 [Planctomycetota bacterium]|jgi:hypothetical protein